MPRRELFGRIFPQVTLRTLQLGALATLLSCGASQSIPDNVESRFDFLTDAFSFANYNDTGAVRFNSVLAARMFGTEVVCTNNALPCDPSELALGWIGNVNETLSEGRSEGFAVLSQLFARGELDPNDFGAETAAGLRIEGNAALQAELAYWATSQQVASVLVDDRRFSANDVMPFLAEAMQPDNEEFWRLAIAIRTETGLTHGHALTPIGYYRGERDGQYFLRIYDSNFPQRERAIEIDTLANVWRYTVIVDADTVLSYEGNAENGNVLYFSPIRRRRGVLPAPFVDAGLSVTSLEGLQLVASSGESSAGFREGSLVEEGGAVLMPAFSSCTSCGSRDIINYHLVDQTDDLVVRVSGGMESSDSTGRSVNVTGPGYTTSVSGLTGDSTDQVEITVSPDGSVGFSSMGSDTPVTIRTTLGEGDNEVTVTVTVSGASTNVSVTLDSMGRPTVNLDGVPEDTTVSIAIEDSPAPGQRMTTPVTFTASGDDTEVKVDPASGAGSITADGATDTCSNEMYDAGFEIGTDCGDTCSALCAAGERCLENANCMAGTTCREDGVFEHRICKGPDCEDDLLNLQETDIDCGGPMCGPCVSTNLEPPACVVDRDCNTDICDGGVCRALNPVHLQVRDAAGVGVPISVVLDGVTTAQTITSRSNVETYLLGNAYVYDLSVGTLPAGVVCRFFTPTSGTTGLLRAGSTTYGRTISMECDTPTPLYVDALMPPPGVVTATLSLSLDGAPSVFAVDHSGLFTAGVYSSTWAASVSQPGFVNVGGQDQFFSCDLTPTSGTGGIPRPRLTCARNRRQVAVRTTGLIGGEVALDQLADGRPGFSTTVSANGVTTVGALHDRDWSLTITSQPGLVPTGPMPTDRAVLTCTFPGALTTATGTRDSTLVDLTCARQDCPGVGCPGFLTLRTTGMPAGGSVAIQQTLDASSSAITVDANSSRYLGEFNTSWNLSVTTQPGMVGGQEIECSFPGDASVASSSTVTTTILDLTCAPVGGDSCMSDAECPGLDCECGANSGACTAAGQCGAGAAFYDQATTNGTAPSGAFTVPAGCSQVLIQGWGAAGSDGVMDDFLFPMAIPGGAGGHVTGTLSVVAGDVISVWVGQGGEVAGATPEFGIPGIGSNAGARTDGGAGDENGMFLGGGGGGLTSVRQTGSATVAFSIPAGGGGTAGDSGGDAGDVSSGGGASLAGEAATVASGGGGGGAGDPGGTAGGGLPGVGGAFGTLPAGFTSAAGSAGTPAGDASHDYGQCTGGGDGSVAPGASGSIMGGRGGNGCVSVRCVAP